MIPKEKNENRHPHILPMYSSSLLAANGLGFESFVVRFENICRRYGIHLWFN